MATKGLYSSGHMVGLCRFLLTYSFTQQIQPAIEAFGDSGVKKHLRKETDLSQSLCSRLVKLPSRQVSVGVDSRQSCRMTSLNKDHYTQTEGWRIWPVMFGAQSEGWGVQPRKVGTICKGPEEKLLAIFEEL